MINVRNLRRPVLLLVGIMMVYGLHAQERGSFSGGFETNGNLFLRDSAIGAYNTPQYNKELYGGEAWLNLNYLYQGFDLGMRFDMFQNSALLNPQGSYSDLGIGHWHIRKSIGDLEVTAGHVYDQIGSGIIFRAYEERTQLIDNALVGLRLKYQISPLWSVKSFIGRQKYLFERRQPLLKGAAIEGYIDLNAEKNWSLAPGIGFLNRTFTDDQVDKLVTVVKGYTSEDQIDLSYNSNAFSLYNNMSYGNINWYAEIGFKPKDVIYDPEAVRHLDLGGETHGKYVNATGTVFYTSLGWIGNKLSLQGEFKRTEFFDWRTDPQLLLNNGLLSYIPPMARVNTYRLTALYVPATQYLSEMAYTLDAKYAFNDKWDFNANFSHIRDKDFEKDLYREIYAEAIWKKSKKLQLTMGVQNQLYNISVYYGKGDVPDVKTITPFVEVLYKFTRRKSLRVESQYMHTEQDRGSWVYALAEYGIAPKLLFELSGMYNIKPKDGEKAIFYPTAGVAYTKGSNRFALRYVKQVEGVVCSGGICRLEPAFSGFKASITSNF